MCLIWWIPLSSPSPQTTQLHPVIGATFFAKRFHLPKSLDGMRMNRGGVGHHWTTLDAIVAFSLVVRPRDSVCRGWPEREEYGRCLPFHALHHTRSRVYSVTPHVVRRPRRWLAKQPVAMLRNRGTGQVYRRDSLSDG